MISVRRFLFDSEYEMNGDDSRWKFGASEIIAILESGSYVYGATRAVIGFREVVMQSAKVSEIYHVTGKTWSSLEPRLRLSARRLIAISKGGVNVFAKTKANIDDVHDEVCPAPLPDSYRRARKSFIRLKASPGSNELRDRIIEIEDWLKDIHPQSIWEKTSRLYMLAFTAISRGLHHGGNSLWFGGNFGVALKGAQNYLEEALALTAGAKTSGLDQDEMSKLKRLEPFIFINWAVVVGEQAKLGYCFSLSEAEQMLLNANIFNRLRKFLKDNRFNWQAVYDGLEFASRFNIEPEMEFFYAKLVQLDRGFVSLDYSPREVPALSKEAGMANFCRWFKKRSEK